ncbi:hypothetical protein RUND412_001184 [Rhizina undulata]
MTTIKGLTPHWGRNVYLYNPDFDAHRRLYLAVNKNRAVKAIPVAFSTKPVALQQWKIPQENGSRHHLPPVSNQMPRARLDPVASSAKPVASQQPKISPGLFNCFESIEREETPMFGNPREQVPPQGAAHRQNAYQATLYEPKPSQKHPPGPQIVSPISQNQPFPKQEVTKFTGNGLGGNTHQINPRVCSSEIWDKAAGTVSCPKSHLSVRVYGSIVWVSIRVKIGYRDEGGCERKSRNSRLHESNFSWYEPVASSYFLCD